MYAGPLPVKHVLVTGGNTGIGFALCRQLAADHSCHVYLGARFGGHGHSADSIPSLLLSSSSRIRTFISPSSSPSSRLTRNLTTRSIPKGEKAVTEILKRHPGVKLELVQIDVSSDESVKAAAAKLKAKGVPLYGVVNNAGAGLSHPGVTVADVLNVNLNGVKRMCAAFLPLLDHWTGRFVNVGSGAGPM